MEETGKWRVRYGRLAPEPMRAQSAIDDYVEKCGLERSLVDLVLLRVSLVNGCSYCLQAHSQDALEHGERVERLFQLGAWEESPVFSARERAALAWADAVTQVRHRHVPEDVYARARTELSEKELVDLTWAVVSINSWNRLSIAFRGQPEIPVPAASGGSDASRTTTK